MDARLDAFPHQFLSLLIDPFGDRLEDGRLHRSVLFPLIEAVQVMYMSSNQ